MHSNLNLSNNFANHKYLIFDYETESLNCSYARPWQLFFSLYDGYNKVEEYNFFIKWSDLNVSKDAARITRFDPAKVEREGKSPAEVIEFFDKYLYNEDYLIIGANILGYDCYIHNTFRLSCGRETNYSWLNRLYDTNCLAKAYRLGLAAPKDEDLLLWQYKLNHFVKKGMKTSVKSMADEFKLEYDENNLHDALFDVKLTWEIFRKLVPILGL